MISKRSIYLIFLMALVTCSCVTRKKTTYLQDSDQSIYPLKNVTPVSYKVEPNDNIYIKVITPDPTWSQIYNILPVTSYSLTTNEQSADLISYTVYEDGTIDFPYIGAVHVAGKTLREIREQIDELLLEYIKDATVIVKLVNNYVSLIGDVQQPGKYPIYKSRLNVFQALAMAGDVAEYSNRREIQIVRQSSKGTVVENFDLTNEKILESELFYVMPNDVIYAKPMKGKFFRMGQFPYIIILTTVTTTLLVLTYINGN